MSAQCCHEKMANLLQLQSLNRIIVFRCFWPRLMWQHLTRFAQLLGGRLWPHTCLQPATTWYVRMHVAVLHKVSPVEWLLTNLTPAHSSKTMKTRLHPYVSFLCKSIFKLLYIQALSIVFTCLEKCLPVFLKFKISYLKRTGFKEL